MNSPAAIAGNYPAGRAQFGPRLTSTGLTGDVVLANDGARPGGTAPGPTDGCCAGSQASVCAAEPWANAADVAGKIAIVDRGICGFAVQGARTPQLKGAIGVDRRRTTRWAATRSSRWRHDPTAHQSHRISIGLVDSERPTP